MKIKWKIVHKSCKYAEGVTKCDRICKTIKCLFNLFKKRG